VCLQNIPHDSKRSVKTIGVLIISQMSDDVEANEYDIGVTSIRLIRVGNVIQMFYSKKLAAELFYKELVEKFKLEQDQFRGT
jgi:hypothetical protein